MTNSSLTDETAVLHIGSPEPAFYPFAGYALRLGRSDRAMADFLAARIESAPTDLLCHTRRIFIAMELNDPEMLFGALVDLFIATGKGALDLRTNLLRQSQAFLRPDQQVFLSKRLEKGILAQTPVFAPRSRLTAGFIGTGTVVVKQSAQSGRSPL